MNHKRVFYLLALFLLSGVLYAQDAQQTKYPFNQLRVSVTPSLCSSLEIAHAGGANIFKSNPTLGAEATISYYQRIVKQFGVSLGFGINFTANSYHFSFVRNIDHSSPIHQQEEMNRVYEPTGMVTIPLAFSMIIPIKSSSWNIDVQVGAKFNYLYEGHSISFCSSWEDSPTLGLQTDEYIKEKSYGWIEENCDQRNIFSYFVKAGATYTTKRNNGFFFNIIANYSPQKILTGTYLFRAIDGDSYGSFKKNMNYLGLEVGYALTLCKKR